MIIQAIENDLATTKKAGRLQLLLIDSLIFNYG